MDSQGALSIHITGPDIFVRNFLVLCKWQHDLELILFTLCRLHNPQIARSRGWKSYRAAELTLLTEQVTRICMDQKPLIANAGVSGPEREDFMIDLQIARGIRHAAVHRNNVSKSTMNRYSACFLRLSATARRIIGPSSDVEFHNILMWMDRQGWPLEAIDSPALRALRDKSDIARRALLEQQSLAKSRKERNKQIAVEARLAAEERRAKGRQTLKRDQQAAKQRIERRQRDDEQRAKGQHIKMKHRTQGVASKSCTEPVCGIFGSFDLELLRFTPLGWI